jgi:hypothetical protein
MNARKTVWFVAAVALWALGSRAQAATLTIAWTYNSTAPIAGFKIHYGTASGSYSSTPLVVTDLDTRLQQIPGLNSGATYFIALTVFDSSGAESGMSNEVTAATCRTSAGSAPSVPQGLTAVSASSSVTVNWTANSATDMWKYRVFYSTVAGHPAALLDVPVGQTSCAIGGLVPSALYYVSIAAINQGCYTSARSSEVSVRAGSGGPMPPTPPNGLWIRLQ